MIGGSFERAGVVTGIYRAVLYFFKRKGERYSQVGSAGASGDRGHGTVGGVQVWKTEETDCHVASLLAMTEVAWGRVTAGASPRPTEEDEIGGNMERKQFTFYRSFWTAIRKLPQELWLAYLVNIITYALDEELLLDMNSTQAGMFELVRPNLDAARKKASAGAEGGRRKKASKQVSKKKNEMENEIENEIEIELETETETDSGEGDAPMGRGSVWLGFERFWDKYPVKIGMEEAWEQWQRLCPDADEMCRSLDVWVRTPQWIKEKGRFIPRAAKFLEQEYYLQAPEVETGATGRLGQAELEAIAKLMKEY